MSGQIVDMDTPNSVGARIRTLREHLRLTQADFSAAVNVSRSFVSKLESDAELPGRGLLLAIAHEFGVSLDWLAAGNGNMQPAHALNENEALLLYAYRSMPLDEAETHLKLMLQRAKAAGEKSNT